MYACTESHSHTHPLYPTFMCIRMFTTQVLYSFLCTGQFKEPNVRLENDLSLTVHNFGYYVRAGYGWRIVAVVITEDNNFIWFNLVF